MISSLSLRFFLMEKNRTYRREKISNVWMHEKKTAPRPEKASWKRSRKTLPFEYFWVDDFPFRIWWDTLQETNISPKNGILKMFFPVPKVGYVNSLEGIYI